MKKTAVLLMIVMLMGVFVPVYASRDDVLGRLKKTQQAEATEESASYDDPMMAIAMEMIRDVHELAGDELYWSTRGLSSVDLIAQLAATDVTDLRSIYRVVISDEWGASMMRVDPNCSEAAHDRVHRNLGSEMMNRSNIRFGNDGIEQATALHWTKAFMAPENYEPCSWLVDCGGALYGLNFVQENDGIIVVTIDILWVAESQTVENRIEGFTQGWLEPAELIWPVDE